MYFALFPFTVTFLQFSVKFIHKWVEYGNFIFVKTRVKYGLRGYRMHTHTHIQCKARAKTNKNERVETLQHTLGGGQIVRGGTLYDLR